MKKQRDDAGRAVLHILCIAAGCLYLAGCAAAPSEYTVMGATNEVSRVTEEAYVPAFAGEDEEAYGGRTGTAAPEEPADDKETAEADGENEGTKSGKQAYRVLISDVNLCDKPGGRVIRVIPSGSRVELLSDVEKGWYKVRYRGASGYVKEGSFKEDQDRLEAEQTKTAAEQQRRMKEEEAEKKAEEEARKKAEEEAKKKAEEEARKKAEEEAKKKAEEEARLKAEEEARKKEEEKKKAEEEAKKKAEEEAKKKAEEEARKKAEEEQRRKEEEERARAMENGEVTRVLATTVNLRDPDNTDELLGIVPAGDTVIVYAALDDGWYLVESRGVRGVIKGGYFTEDDP